MRLEQNEVLNPDQAWRGLRLEFNWCSSRWYQICMYLCIIYNMLIYIYTYICMYICICKCICICICICISICICIYIYMCL
jgi:hypothetical protein